MLHELLETMTFRARFFIPMLLIANTIILRCTGNTNISTRVLIEIYTRDEVDAGTTCSVVLKLIGTKSSSRFLVMNPEGGEFPRGSKQDFYRRVVDYGSLVETRVFHACDDPYKEESWGLEKIVLTNLNTNQMYQTNGSNRNIPNGAMWKRTTKAAPIVENATPEAHRVATTPQVEATTTVKMSLSNTTTAKRSTSVPSTKSMKYANITRAQRVQHQESSPTITSSTQRTSGSTTNRPSTIPTTLLPSKTTTNSKNKATSLWKTHVSTRSQDVAKANLQETTPFRQITPSDPLVSTFLPLASQLGRAPSQESDESTESYYWIVPVLLIAVGVGILPAIYFFVKRENRSSDKSIGTSDRKNSNAQEDDMPEITGIPTSNDPDAEEANISVSVVGTAGSPSEVSSSVPKVITVATFHR